MWHAVTEILKAEGVTVDQEKAFFIGDAAGRKMDRITPSDHSASDRKFAVNIGIQFHTPQVRALASFKGFYNL
jgi:bifunctional polynucleotide phosphatase/kinase